MSLYRIAGKCSGEIRSTPEGWEVELHPLDKGPTDEECAHAFRTELVDQSLREQIGAKTEHVKTLILSNAFSKTTLIPQDECASTPT